MAHYRLEIEGMGCETCVKAVTNALLETGDTINGVQVGSADILFEGEEGTLRSAIEDVGFDLTEVRTV